VSNPGYCSQGLLRSHRVEGGMSDGGFPYPKVTGLKVEKRQITTYIGIDTLIRVGVRLVQFGAPIIKDGGAERRPKRTQAWLIRNRKSKLKNPKTPISG
jgi:hypothetical protein